MGEKRKGNPKYEPFVGKDGRTYYRSKHKSKGVQPSANTDWGETYGAKEVCHNWDEVFSELPGKEIVEFTDGNNKPMDASQALQAAKRGDTEGMQVKVNLDPQGGGIDPTVSRANYRSMFSVRYIEQHGEPKSNRAVIPFNNVDDWQDCVSDMQSLYDEDVSVFNEDYLREERLNYIAEVDPDHAKRYFAKAKEKLGLHTDEVNVDTVEYWAEVEDNYDEQMEEFIQQPWGEDYRRVISTDEGKKVVFDLQVPEFYLP